MSESSFLILLGILILVSAVIVLYFESKIRDQNHKIASMFSLVTSLADETHQIKRVFQGHSYLGGTSSMNNYTNATTNNSYVPDPCVHDLIEVSEDEDEEEDDSEEEEEDEESNGENDDESEDDDDGIKVIKLLNISDTTYTQLNIDSELESENGDDTELDTLYVKQVLGLKYSDDEKEYEKEEDEEKKDEEEKDEEKKEEKKREEEGDDKGTEEKGTEDKETEGRKGAKHISIDLGENFPMDYKKMQLPKLRQVVVDKELASHVEASKLKKPELLKLLGEL